MQTEGLMRQRCWQTVQGVEQGLDGLCDLEESSGGDLGMSTRGSGHGPDGVDTHPVHTTCLEVVERLLTGIGIMLLLFWSSQ